MTLWCQRKHSRMLMLVNTQLLFPPPTVQAEALQDRGDQRALPVHQRSYQTRTEVRRRVQGWPWANTWPQVFKGRARHYVPKTMSMCERSQKPEPGTSPSESTWPKRPTKAETDLPRVIGAQNAWSQEKGQHRNAQAKDFMRRKEC